MRHNIGDIVTIRKYPKYRGVITHYEKGIGYTIDWTYPDGNTYSYSGYGETSLTVEEEYNEIYHWFMVSPFRKYTIEECF